MKKRVLISLLICSILLVIALPFSAKSYADPFTAGQIASTAYAMMQSWGVSFTAGSASASGMNDFMAEQVQDYVNSHGGSIADVFVGQIAVDVAGKLVVAHTMYNSVVGFLDWLKDKYSLSASDFALTDGKYQDTFLPSSIDGNTWGQYTMEFHTKYPASYHGWQGYFLYDGDRKVLQPSYTTSDYRFLGTWSIDYNDGSLYCVTPVINGYTGDYVRTDRRYFAYVGTLTDSLSWSVPESWTMPTVLNPDQEWTGTIGGYSAPDTNLDQLLGDVNQAVADNNLVVDGEVIDIDPPQPTPTYMPIDPGTPLQDVPWEGLDNNLYDLYEQGLEEIGAIGDAQDAITGSINNQTGVVQDLINSSTNSVSGAINQAISSQTGVVQDLINSSTNTVSGAISQAASDIQSAIGDQTSALDQSLSATAEGVETIAEALEDEAINWPKFNLRGLFPFCIPFDIYNMLEALDASPTAPHVQLPFVISSINFSYTIDLDFSSFDQVASVMRTMELIVYGIALAWATSKVIKW